MLTTGASARAAMLAALLLTSAGCQTAGVRPGSTPAAAVETTPAADIAVPAATPWWRSVDDPVLASLVQQGLDRNGEVACRVASLRVYDQTVAHEEKRIGTRLRGLLGDKSVRPDPTLRDARVERIVVRRVRVARQIARTYIEVRRLQQDLTLRAALRDQYKDNAEVAQFRREAGLVPAIDGSLARSQDESASGEAGYVQARLDSAIAELAQLVGETPEGLAAKLGSPGAIPDPRSDPLADTPPEDPRRGKLGEAVLREARLTQAADESRRTVRDARTAYRGGAGSFATLYVAEAAALAAQLALVDARAVRVGLTVDLWSGKDDAWAREGLTPLVPDPTATDATITVTAPCDD